MNAMLALAKAEGHKPFHKSRHSPINRYQGNSLNLRRTQDFIKRWKGGPFTNKDVVETVGAVSKTRCTTANFMVTKGLARRVGRSDGNTTLFELTGEKP